MAGPLFQKGIGFMQYMPDHIDVAEEKFDDLVVFSKNHPYSSHSRAFIVHELSLC